jgi:hypothetical protein
LFVGKGDLHEVLYDDQERRIQFSEYYKDLNLALTSPGNCMPEFYIYPSHDFVEAFSSNLPKIAAAFVASTFVLMAISFFFFDLFLQRRNKTLLEAAIRGNVVLSSLFPTNIRGRILEVANEDSNCNLAFLTPTLTSRQSSPLSLDFGSTSSQIADLFPNTTVMYADITGFTAWSSEREPFQVFTLLETVYGAFDQLAKKRQVCKVETIGGKCFVSFDVLYFDSILSILA